LLIEPNPESALNPEAGRLLLEDYTEFSKQAKLMTEVYAMRKENKNPQKSPVKKKSASSRRL